MTTSEFIKMLQEEDPLGTAHVRIAGGVPYKAELKDGYWDGPYSYIDDKKYVTSCEAVKVDIFCMDIEEFVEYNHAKGYSWEDIEKRFIFKLDCYANESDRNEKSESVLNEARKHYDTLIEIHERLYQEGLIKMIENANKGWRWFQNKLVDDFESNSSMHHHYTWKIFNEQYKEEGSNIINTESIVKSGKWEKHDNNVMPGYYQWKFKETEIHET